jgi:hypothetical protein
VQKHTLIGVRETQDVARLRRGEPSEIAQDEQLALGYRKLGDRVEDDLARLSR